MVRLEGHIDAQEEKSDGVVRECMQQERSTMQRSSIGVVFLGALVLLSAAWIVQKPLLQVYWALNSRIPDYTHIVKNNPFLRIDTGNETHDVLQKQAQKPVSEALRDVETTVGLEGYRAASTGDVLAPAPSAVQAEDHRLSRALVKGVAPHGPVMVTWANFHYLDFVLNWVEHIRKCRITSYLVGSMDDRILQELVERGINTFAMHSGLSEDDFGWGSPTFHKMGREKIHLIETFTDMGFDILVSDVDTVWLKDPLPYMAKYPEADILTSSDHLRNTTGDDGLELWPDSASAANIGIMLFRRGAGKLAKEWNRVLAEDDKVWDQNAFNDLFRLHIEVNAPSTGLRTFMGYDGTLAIGILPVALFASGHTYFVQRLHERMGLEVYCVHATFQYSGTTGKRHRMRERMLWVVDPPEYYDPPGGLLAYQPQLGNLVNESVIKGDGMELDDYRGHFNLVNAQLTQLRNALAIASILGRALVLPDLWCGADRWWAPHQGTIPGSALLLPFRCPADHVLDLGRMAATDLSLEQFGPIIPFREYSLLENPKMLASQPVQPGSNPKMAPEQTAPALVQVCQAGQGQSCRQPGRLAAPGEASVSIEADLKEGELVKALQPLKEERVLMFTDMRQAFGGFAKPADAERFEERLKIYSSLWCCVNKHPGHVWYDFMWDVVPHTDRHGRAQNGPWQPVTGP